MSDLIGVNWGSLPTETKDFFLTNNMIWDNVKEGECIIDLTDNLAVSGYIKYTNRDENEFEIIIDDNSILYNPEDGIILESSNKDRNTFILNDVLTVNEAASIWGVAEGTIRSAIKSKKLIPGIDFRKSGRITLITRDIMNKLYGCIDELINSKKGISYNELFEFVLNNVEYTYNVKLCLKNFLIDMSETGIVEDVFYMTKESEQFLIRTHFDIINEDTEDEEIIYTYDVEKII